MPAYVQWGPGGELSCTQSTQERSPYAQYGGSGTYMSAQACAFCSSSVRGSGLISRTALVAEVDTTLMLPASKAAEIEMAVEKAVPTTPESMAGRR
jgi:hypothetical protein